MFEIQKEKKHPANILEAIAVQEKSKASDRFYNELGYEIQEVQYSIERLELDKDPEMIELVKHTQELIREFVKDQTQQ